MSTAAGRPPSLSANAVCKLVTRYFKVKNAVEDSVKAFPSYDDVNYYLQGEHLESKSTEFVLKVGNPVHTSLPVTKGLNKMMHHISSKGFNFLVPYPLLGNTNTDLLSLTAGEMTLNGSVNSTAGGNIKDEELLEVNFEDVAMPPQGKLEYHVRLLTYVPGELFDNVDKKYLTPTLLRDVGETLGIMDKDLKVT